jgi:phospholipase/lecithinase/hemolysin
MKRSVLISVFALVLLIPVAHPRAGYSGLFVFGDSISDRKQLYCPAATSNQCQYGAQFYPFFPMRPGITPTISVGATASSLALAQPSLLGGADYAFGGASTLLLNIFLLSLVVHTAFLLFEYGPLIPGSAL